MGRRGRSRETDNLGFKQSTAMFIKIGDIKGTSTAPGFEGWTNVLAWSWGCSNSISSKDNNRYNNYGDEEDTQTQEAAPTTNAENSAEADQYSIGKANIQDMSLTKYTDIGSPQLAFSVLQAKKPMKVVLRVCRERVVEIPIPQRESETEAKVEENTDKDTDKQEQTKSKPSNVQDIKEYLIVQEYIMNDAFITSLSTGGSGGETRLTENIVIQFHQLQMSYNPTLDVLRQHLLDGDDDEYSYYGNNENEDDNNNEEKKKYQKMLLHDLLALVDAELCKPVIVSYNVNTNSGSESAL